MEYLEEEIGYCGTCRRCSGVDEATDTCECEIDDPHRDWRYRDNEKCPNWIGD